MKITNQLPTVHDDFVTGLHKVFEENKILDETPVIAVQNKIKIASYKKERFLKTKNSLSVVKANSTGHSNEKCITDLEKKVEDLQSINNLKEEEINNLKLDLIEVKSNMHQFSYIASHDLKEPLRMVTSYLSLLKNKFGPQLGEKANSYIEFAIDGGARLHTMFNGLLDLSQTGRVDEEKKELCFEALIKDTLTNLSKKIKNTKAEIKICTPLPIIRGYEKSLNRLLDNLICNALKFSKNDSSPVIEISATEKASEWEFCIADNGIGIEPSYYQQIFAVFSKLHPPVMYAGNGIGLAICKKAVEHHGGRMWVNSEINKGSNFCFTIPK